MKLSAFFSTWLNPFVQSFRCNLRKQGNKASFRDTFPRGWVSFGAKRWISIYLRHAEDWLQFGRRIDKGYLEWRRLDYRRLAVGVQRSGWTSGDRYGVWAKGKTRIKTRLEGPRAIVSLIVARRHRLPMCTNKTPEGSESEEGRRDKQEEAPSAVITSSQLKRTTGTSAAESNGRLSGRRRLFIERVELSQCGSRTPSSILLMSVCC